MTDDRLLLFLSHKYFEQGKAIRGGALVTNIGTRPVEFRCTSPIRPNEFQRVLYGSTLDDHVFLDLIGKPLVDRAPEGLSLVLVEDERFLGLRTHIDVPVARIVPAPEDADQEAPSIEVHPDFIADTAYAESTLEDVLDRAIDPTEPFERIGLVLEQAHEKRVGDEQAKA
jgi:hypothetical protein